jgi:hypothetical protein
MSKQTEELSAPMVAMATTDADKSASVGGALEALLLLAGRARDRVRTGRRRSVYPESMVCRDAGGTGRFL